MAENPASQESIDALHEMLNLIFFAQAEILVRMKQKPKESAHYPLYQKEALAVCVGMEQAAIKEAHQQMLAQLAANAEPIVEAEPTANKVRNLRRPSGTN